MNSRSQRAGSRPTSTDVRNRLLDAAEALLGERRSSAITSRDIARMAGLSDGVLYNHFGDRQELLLSALVRRFERLTSPAAVQPPEDPAGSIDESVSEVVRRAHALHVAVLPMLVNLVGDPPLLERFLVEIHRPPLGGELFTAPIVEALTAEQARGRLGSFDPAAAADLILGGVLMQALIDVLGHRSAEEVGDRLDGMSRTILSGLRPTAPTHPTRPSGGPDDHR
jgi:AcrR family transcriptional regulator